MRRGVDGGGGCAGAHDRQVGEDPLVARAGSDADPLLRLDAEREQAGGELVDAVAGLRQVTDSQASLPPGYRYASRSGDAATRSRNWTATLRARLSTRVGLT